MLENIKFILDIKSDEHDELILFLIKKLSIVVLDYCNIEELNIPLENFIENKVASILNYVIEAQKNNTENTGGITSEAEVKAITRGDTKIEYNVGTPTEQTSSSKKTIDDMLMFTQEEKTILNRHRRLKL